MKKNEEAVGCGLRMGSDCSFSIHVTYQTLCSKGSKVSGTVIRATLLVVEHAILRCRSMSGVRGRCVQRLTPDRTRDRADTCPRVDGCRVPVIFVKDVYFCPGAYCVMDEQMMELFSNELMDYH
jgi:hypothetical protein